MEAEDEQGDLESVVDEVEHLARTGFWGYEGERDQDGKHSAILESLSESCMGTHEAVKHEKRRRVTRARENELNC